MPLKNFVWAYPPNIRRKCFKRFKFRKVTQNEVDKELRKLKSKKATGIDGIPSKLLKDCAYVISFPLTFIINQSLESSTVPSEWKVAKVVPLFKSGKPTELDNYRPISILPVLSKVQEKLIHAQLMSFLEANQLLSSKQFGFRSKKSTELAVVTFLDHIRHKMDEGYLTGAVFIDLSKAFDTVSHSALLNKLPSYGIDSNELMWITDYLFNRKQTVFYNNNYSIQQPVFSGVPQGSVLGPLLFIIHFDEVISDLKHSHGIKYADDTVIYFSHKDPIVIQNKLSEDMGIINTWLEQNDLVLNLKKGKTETMLFGTAKRLYNHRDHKLEVKIRNFTINNTSEYKYLGVKIDPTLSLSTHFNEVYRKASGRLRLLHRLRNSLTVYSSISVYRAYILPIITYCAVANLHLSNTQKRRLQSISRRATETIKGNSHTVITLSEIYNQIKCRSCCLVAEILSGRYENFINYFVQLSNATRNNGTLLRLPAVKLEAGKNSFKFMGAQIFNELTVDIRLLINENTLTKFKTSVKHFYE